MTDPMVAPPLTADESAELHRCEAVIEQGVRTFLDVGTALARVRDLRLYRTDYATFEAYCDERWGLKRQRAYELMSAASIVQHMSEISDMSPPANEAQARPLTRLKDADQQRQAWQAVIERAQELGQRITAALVEAVVRELQAAAEPMAADPTQLVVVDEVVQPAPVTDATERAEASPPPIPDRLGKAPDDDLGNPTEAPDDLDEPRPAYPDDLESLTAVLREQGYDLVQEREDRLTFQRPDGGEIVTIVKPPPPEQVRMWVVAHRETNWKAIEEQLVQAGVELDPPRSGHLPTYPETQRAYGTLHVNARGFDLNAALWHEMAHKDDLIADLRAQNEALVQRLKALEPDPIYQLKITLEGCHPPIWRRIQVAGDTTLADLSTIILTAMGWEGYHQHQFLIGGASYGNQMPMDYDDSSVTLAQVTPRVPTSFVYEYDFGDDWQHDVQVEKILDARPGVVYPRCIKGNRACPPEDCGGVWGYADMLRRQKQQKSKGRRRSSAFSFDNDAYDFLDEEEVRFRMSFDPTAFDLDAVNAALARLQER